MNRYLLIGGRRHGEVVELRNEPWTIDLHGQGYRHVRWWAFGKPFDLYIQQTAIVSSIEINGMIREHLLQHLAQGPANYNQG